MAKRRLEEAADAVAARLVQIALSHKSKHTDAIAAARDVLDRAGVRRLDGHTLQPAQDGTILWEEFVQIHRRKVTEANGMTRTANDSAALARLPAAPSALGPASNGVTIEGEASEVAGDAEEF